jgi:polyisoprenoid-binding protein YceI
MKHFLIAGTLAAGLLSASAGFAHAQAIPGLNPTAVTPGTYSVEPYHTRVLFSVSHMGFTAWYGEFTNVSGNLTLDPKNVAASTLDITIPADTISTSNTKLDGELKSNVWFDVAQYPTITFKSTKVIKTGKRTANIIGDLTFHGVTKPETLHVTFNGAGINPIDKAYTAGFQASGEIKRSDFGVKTYLPMIGDDVTLIISAAFEHKS